MKYEEINKDASGCRVFILYVVDIRSTYGSTLSDSLGSMCCTQNSDSTSLYFSLCVKDSLSFPQN